MVLPPTSPRFSLRAAPVLFSLAALAGCVSTPGPQVAGTGRCSDATLGWAVGQPADEANLRRLSSESGAGLVNPIGPTTAVKHDTRSDRLRVYIDAQNQITAARCE